MKKLMFFKKLYWDLKFRLSTKRQLVEALKSSDQKVASLALGHYLLRLAKQGDFFELMLIVYDDDNEFGQAVRFVAGGIVLEVLKHDHGWQYFKGMSGAWFNLNSGRLAYLIGIYYSVPILQKKAMFIVEKFFRPSEQQNFYEFVGVT